MLPDVLLLSDAEGGERDNRQFLCGFQKSRCLWRHTGDINCPRALLTLPQGTAMLQNKHGLLGLPGTSTLPRRSRRVPTTCSALSTRHRGDSGERFGRERDRTVRLRPRLDLPPADGRKVVRHDGVRAGYDGFRSITIRKNLN